MGTTTTSQILTARARKAATTSPVLVLSFGSLTAVSSPGTRQERTLIRSKHAKRPHPSRSVPFSLAFSGGGVRAAAFEAGVLWQLAETGRLASVEHLVAVSGGAYTASGFASTVASAGPEERTGDFYLRCVAKTICRMQRNAGYLIRDLRPGHFWEIATDGSSRVPPILDTLLLIVMVAFSIIINPLTALALYVMPFSEGVDLFDGACMRAAYCAPNTDVGVTIFSNWGPLQSSVWALCVCVMTAFILWCVSKIPPLRIDKGWPAPRVAQLMMSLRAVVTRASVVQLLIIVIVTGAFIAQLDENPERTEQCEAYIRKHMAFENGEACLVNIHCHDYYHGYPWWTAAYFDSYFTDQERAWVNSSMPGLPLFRKLIEGEELEPQKSRIASTMVHLNQILVSLQKNILRKISAGLGSTTVGAFLTLTLLVSLILNPFFHGLFLWTLSLIGPVISLFIVGSIVQYRVFAPITGQTYAWGLFPWPSQENWSRFVIAMFTCGIVIVLFYHHLHSVSHTFYARSLQKAYFQGGQDWQWADVRDNPYLPFLLFTGTVTDFRRPEDVIPITEIFMSPLHTGSDKTGYVYTPGWRSLSKSAALAAAASDAFIIGMLDRARYRFWLEFLNLRMGDYILFERRPLHLVAKISQYRCLSDKPFFLYGIIPICLQTFGLTACLVSFLLSSDTSKCQQSKSWYLVWALLLSSMISMSFFAGRGMLEIFLHSPAIRHLHMALRYYHIAEKGPSLMYVTDGGVQDCTGILQLLRRRSARILLALASSDPDDELSVLRETMRLASEEKLASFYDARDPRRDALYVLDDFKLQQEQCHFVLGIRYPVQTGGGEYGARLTGRLFVVKNRLPPSMETLQAEPLLTEEEIMSRARDHPHSPRWKHRQILQSDLAGCCCDCCHVNMCNVGPKFPHISNANQCLTPALFNALCRLGHRLSAPAVDLIGREGPLEEETWEANLPR
ncbi:unnamed protein product [Effrenium voratum]|nr:unnamed protein product [Effrenium voratum]CAJ1428166.1 unnamed protein product [Effrenium voratum]